MRKEKVGILTPRQFFKFGENSSEYFVVSHTRDSANSPVTKVMNLKTYTIRIVSSYTSVFLPPYEFTKQLTIF